jgi:hypothetical protein
MAERPTPEESDMNVRPMWTESELDEALETLERTLAADADALAGIRARVLVGVNGAAPARRRHRPAVRWAGMATGLAAALVGGLVLTAVGASKPPPVYAETVRTLDGAAELSAHAQDPAVGPGQYLYVATHAWWRADAMRFSYLGENLIETWIPSDRTQEWLERRTVTGRRQWLAGNEKDARAAGVLEEPGWPEGDTRARCGDFDGSSGHPRAGSCAGHGGGWQNPTPAFLAGLPRDPAVLYARLRADTKGHGRDPDAEVLVYVTDALRTGQVPADVRAALYRALTRLPGLKVVDHRANLDGRQGVALGTGDGGGGTQQIIIDPATGQFIGERSVDSHGRPEDITSVTTSVATAIGVRPS